MRAWLIQNARGEWLHRLSFGSPDVIWTRDVSEAAIYASLSGALGKIRRSELKAKVILKPSGK